MSHTPKSVGVIRTAVLAMLSALAVAPLQAQRAASNPIELGADVAFTRVSSRGISYSRFSVPIESFRVGFFVSNRVSLEPAVRYQWAKGEGSDGASSYDVNAGLLVHTRKVRGAPQLFLKPLVGFEGFRDGESRSRPYVGLGGGLKAHGTNRMAFRTAIEYQRALESRPWPSEDRLSLQIGLSYFTR